MKCELPASGEGASASSSSGTPLGFQVRQWPGLAAEDAEDGGDQISPRPMSDKLNGCNEENGEEGLKIGATRSLDPVPLCFHADGVSY